MKKIQVETERKGMERLYRDKFNPKGDCGQRRRDQFCFTQKETEGRVML